MASEDSDAAARQRLCDWTTWDGSGEAGQRHAARTMKRWFNSNETELRLGSCSLCVLPDDLAIVAPHLRLLDVRGNKLNTLPDWIGDCVNLRTLIIADNRMIHFPESMSRLTSLTILDISNFRSQSFLRPEETRGKMPEWIRGCTELGVLVCRSCGLAEIPDWVGEFAQMSLFDCSGENEYTTIPESLKNCPSLFELMCSGTHLAEPWASLFEQDHAVRGPANQTRILAHLSALTANRDVKSVRP